jgi:hypothetical protein
MIEASPAAVHRNQHAKRRFFGVLDVVCLQLRQTDWFVA